jgi:site-specific DNA-cytosine methylase
MDGLPEDSSDSDQIVFPSRRSRSTTLLADLDDGLGKAYRYASADYNEEYDDEENDNDEDSDTDFDSRDESEIDGKDDNEENIWSAFSHQLREVETDSNICRLYPSSLHADWHPSVQPCNEYEALEQMILAEGEESAFTFPGNHHDLDHGLPDYQEFILRDFVVYVSVEENNLPGHMQSLDVVATECKKIDFYVDGYLEQEDTGKYLHRILIQRVNIGCLEDQGRHSAKDQIYVQTEVGGRVGFDLNQDVWYRLERPATKYSKLFADFLWVADLMKHFVDYLTINADIGQKVYLEDFRARFIQQLYTWHSSDGIFQAWHKKCGSKSDLRQYIARHANFLNNQTWSLENKPGARLLRQPIWWQICPRNDFSSSEGPRTGKEQTVVTQNVMQAFCATFPVWGPDGLDLLKVVNAATPVENARRQRMQALGFPDKFRASGLYQTLDNITLTADTLEKVGCANSRPRTDHHNFVGKVVVIRRDGLDENDPKFRCSYAFVRRTISHRRQQALSIVWLVHPRETICREAFYPHGNELFFSDECSCQPVLLTHVMAVFGISIFSDHAEADATFFAREQYSENEECFRTASTSDLECSCLSGSLIEQGNSREASVRASLNTISPITLHTTAPNASANVPILEAAAPLLPSGAVCPNLRNLSLFTGSGNFDRGLEESNVIQTTYAIDCSEYGMQSSMANQKDKGRHRTESVNYCLHRILQAVDEHPQIDCISAGCPCVGFSGLNNHKAGENAQRNCSLLASTLSYVELLLPHYVVIENVPLMDKGSPNACQQVICCLVGLGYQVRKTLLKACDFGAPQSRLRLFIIAASSGLPLPRNPQELALGGPPSTVADAIKGLPVIDNDTIINITKPDHIPLRRLQPEFGVVNLRTLVQKISASPPAMNLYKTNQLGLLTHTETQWFLNQSDERRRKGSKSLGRVDPSKPFPTVVTAIHPMCSRSGTVVHPYEDRLMSLEEYKIAQGFLDDDVIIGPLGEQLKQVGNAVARPVGVAIGLVIAESWCAANEAVLGSRRTQAMEQTYDNLQQDKKKVESTWDKMSVLTMDEDTRSDETLVKEEEDSQNVTQQALHTPVIAIEDSDSSSESPSQTSRKRSSLLSAFSAHDSPDAQLQAELQAAVAKQSLSSRRKRVRTIPDSDDEDASGKEQYAIASPAVRRHMDWSRPAKSARTTSETLAASINVADDPI